MLIEPKSEVRLSDVISDGTEAVRALLAEGKLTAEQVQLPTSRLPTTGLTKPYVDAMLNGLSDRARVLAANAAQWMAENQIPYLTNVPYVTPDGRPTAAKAPLGASDGSLLVEVGRTPGWKAERAAEVGFSLLLVPFGFEAPLGLLLVNPNRDAQPPTPAPRGLKEDDAHAERVMGLAGKILGRSAPELMMWHDLAAIYRTTLDLAVLAGLDAMENAW